MSALVAAGEITAADWQLLKAHLEECAECRSIFSDVAEIEARWLPEHPDFEIARDAAADRDLREKILRRVSKEGARFSKAARAGSAATPALPPVSRIAPLWFAAGAAAALVTVVAVAMLPQVRNYVEWREDVQRSRASAQVTSAQLQSAQPQSGEVQSARAAVTAPQPSASANGKLQLKTVADAKAALENALKVSQAEQAELRVRLAQQATEIGLLAKDKNEAARQTDDLNTQLASARAYENQLQAEISRLKSVAATGDAVSATQEDEIRVLQAKLTEQTNGIERERDLLSKGREIRDLIAARNLHIIDVYDTNGKGKTTAAFGRVFYTEGKSLVFYAYDLGGHADSGKYAFYVWGKRDSNPHAIKSLGEFAKDDLSQKRWVLTVTDPQVLAEIDSVFVTLEPVHPQDGHSTIPEPKGKRLLSAYLDTPANHP
jgi:hypothetical protein